VGQVGNLRPIVNRPCSRVRQFLRRPLYPPRPWRRTRSFPTSSPDSRRYNETMVAELALFLFLQGPDFTAEGLKALDEHRYDAAVQAFQKAIAADAKDYGAHFNLALAYSMLHRDSDGIAEYRKTLELKPGLFEAELNGGILLLRTKNPGEALPLLDDAVRQKPAEYRPRYYLAESQLQTGDAAKAEENYRLALGVNPKSAAAELGLGRALARLDHLADGAPHFRQAATLDAGYHDALLELADLYEKNKQVDEALALYREFPENVAVQEHVGQLMLERKQYADAIPGLEQAYKKDPTQANRVALALAYLFHLERDKALPLLKEAAAAEPANYDVRMAYGRALRDARQFPAAASEFHDAVKLKPTDPAPWRDYADMAYMAGDLPSALAAFEKARDLGEDTAGNCFFRAIILDKLKQLKPALEAYQRFLTMSQGKNPDQEWQARQRVKLLEREVEKR
jgi:tetratricopeptide (TPR) repeat protein